MTVLTLARYLRCDKTTIYRLLKTKQIPAFKVGSDWRFRRSDIDAWIARLYETNTRVTPRGSGRKRGRKPKVG